MDIRLDTILRPGKGGSRFINPALATAAVICAIMFIRALWQPVYVQKFGGGKTGMAVERDAVRAAESRQAYNVIVEKDLFRPVRQKYAPPPKPANVKPPPPPPPRLTLIGTVLLDDGQAAVLDFPGRGQRSSYFKVGDNIEGFVIREIRSDSVRLERDGEGLRVDIRQGTASLPSLSGAPDVQTTPIRLPSRLPPQFTLPPAR